MFFQQSYEEKALYFVSRSRSFFEAGSNPPLLRLPLPHILSRIRLLQSVYHPKHRRLSTSRSADHRQNSPSSTTMLTSSNALYLPKLFVTCSRRIIPYAFIPLYFLFLLESFFKRFCSHGFRKIFYSNPDVFKNSSATSASSRPSSST